MSTQCLYEYEFLLSKIDGEVIEIFVQNSIAQLQSEDKLNNETNT